MTYDTVWCVTWHFTGQYDLRCHIKSTIIQPPSNINNNTQDDNPVQGTHSSSSSTEERGLLWKKPSVGHIVMPYIKGLGENFEKICGKYGIQTNFKGNRTLKQLLVKPKDQDPKEKKSGVIYSY